MKRFCQTLTLMLLLLSICSCTAPQKPDSRSKHVYATQIRSPIRLVVHPEKDGEESLHHKVFLDGSFIGHYNPSGSSDSRGMQVRVLCDKQHTIEIVSEGYRTQTVSFIKLDGTEQLIRFNMEKE